MFSDNADLACAQIAALYTTGSGLTNFLLGLFEQTDGDYKELRACLAVFWPLTAFVTLLMVPYWFVLQAGKLGDKARFITLSHKEQKEIMRRQANGIG